MKEKWTVENGRKVMRRNQETEETISTLIQELGINKEIYLSTRQLERRFAQCGELLKVDLEEIKDTRGHYAVAGNQIAKAKSLLKELAQNDGVFMKILKGKRNEIKAEDIILTYTRMVKTIEEELDGPVKDEFIAFLDEITHYTFLKELGDVCDYIDRGAVGMELLPYEEKVVEIKKLKSAVEEWYNNL